MISGLETPNLSAPAALLAAFSRSLLHLDDDVGNGRPISVEDHDIRPLRGVSSERDRIFHLNPRKWIFVTVQKLV